MREYLLPKRSIIITHRLFLLLVSLRHLGFKDTFDIYTYIGVLRMARHSGDPRAVLRH
jgi:hypothetical protein